MNARMAVAVVIVTIISYFALQFASFAYSGQGPEKLSPAKRMADSWLSIQADRVALEIPGAAVIRIADTNSMDPTLDAEATILTISPRSPEEIHVGDIIVYRNSAGSLIIHRVIDIHDNHGSWWVITKGDNNSVPDSEKVRFEQIEGVVIGILY